MGWLAGNERVFFCFVWLCFELLLRRDNICTLHRQDWVRVTLGIMVYTFFCWVVLKVIWLESAARSNNAFIFFFWKKTGLAPCFCNTNDVLVLMSGCVVTKANLSYVDGGVRCSLVNCSTVATTELFNCYFRIFAVLLIKSSAVTEATLG